MEKYFSRKNISVTYSNTRRYVNDFEKYKSSEEIFNLFLNSYHIRTIFQVLVNKIFINNDLITLQELEPELSDKLNVCFDEPLYIDYICPECSTVIHTSQWSDKVEEYYICQYCRNKIKSSKCELSYYSGEDIPTPYQFLDIYSETGLMTKEYYGTCPRCREAKTIPYATHPKNSINTNKFLEYFYCSKCSELYEISHFYRMANKKIIDLWSSGLWLEWYIKKLCKKGFPKSVVKQGLILKRNNDVLEVDVILYKNNKTYGIECKSLSPLKNADWGDISNVFKYKRYIDVPILACTGKLKITDKKILQEEGIQIIENNDIEKIGPILKKK